MKLSFLTVAACANILTSGVAMAQNAPISEPAPTIQAASANPTGAPLICKYYYYNGHMLPRRDCRTAHEWERIRYSTQQSISDFQRQSLMQQE